MVLTFSNIFIWVSLLILFLLFFGIPAIETYLKFQTVITEDIVKYKDIGNIIVVISLKLSKFKFSAWNNFCEYGKVNWYIWIESWMENECILWWLWAWWWVSRKYLQFIIPQQLIQVIKFSLFQINVDNFLKASWKLHKQSKHETAWACQ